MVAQTWLEAATYPQAADAQAAVAELRREGFTEPEISVLYTDAGHTIQAGMINGALWGGVLGALWGLLFPPVGLLVAAGPILGVFISGVGLAAAGQSRWLLWMGLSVPLFIWGCRKKWPRAWESVCIRGHSRYCSCN